MLVDDIDVTIDAEGVLAGAIVARGCVSAEGSEGLDQAVEGAIGEAAARTDVQARVSAVRDLLRYGRYKPTGRGKPASEYLLNAARDGRFPRISPLVDINNLISLRWLLPISLIDLDRAAATAFVVRRGRSGESYVFNPSGQTIDLEDLLLVAHLPADRPCATAVKDSMETKLTADSRNVLAIIYAPATLREELEGATEQFAGALTEWGGASAVKSALLR